MKKSRVGTNLEVSPRGAARGQLTYARVDVGYFRVTGGYADEGGELTKQDRA